MRDLLQTMGKQTSQNEKAALIFVIVDKARDMALD